MGIHFGVNGIKILSCFLLFELSTMISLLGSENHHQITKFAPGVEQIGTSWREKIRQLFSQDRKKVIEDRRKFAQGTMNIEPHSPCKTFSSSAAEIGRGGFGSIYEGRYNNRDIIVKKDLHGNRTGLRDEFNRSNQLIASSLEALEQKDVDFARLQGIGSVVKVLGLADDGTIIQERVNGQNGSDTIFGKLINPHALVPSNAFGPPSVPYALGWPDDPQGAISRAASFVMGVLAIHALGFVHCDLKLHNTIIENNARSGYPMYIIDLGAMKKVGEKIEGGSSNGAPDGFGFGPVYATTAYDMYSVGTMLPGILFGKNALWLNDEYWGNFFSPSHHVQMRRVLLDEELEQYIFVNLLALNIVMKDDINKEYPLPVIQKLSKIITALTSLDAAKRPTAVEVILELTDMALADWEHGFYSIQMST